MDKILLSDALRGVAFCAYVVVAIQIGYVLYHYGQTLRLESKIGANPKRKGLLIVHVLLVSAVTGGFATQALVMMMVRLGESLRWYGFTTTALLVFTAVSLQALMSFEYRRYAEVSAMARGLAKGDPTL